MAVSVLIYTIICVAVGIFSLYFNKDDVWVVCLLEWYEDRRGHIEPNDYVIESVELVAEKLY